MLEPLLQEESSNHKFREVIDAVSGVVLGKRSQTMLALSCLFAKGHLLIEDIPGIGKTTLAKALATALGLEFNRVQCTSDMLPSDILGSSIFDQRKSEFVFHPGPVFTQVLLADEINRSSPKTQSALLEAMEERQVSLEGETHLLPSPFFVVATQNPREQSGTFPLPESQMDRFLMRLELGYPERDAEHAILSRGGTRGHEVKAVLNAKELLSIQDKVSSVHASATLIDYVQDLLEFSRNSGHFMIGLSPRAGIALLSVAKSWAFLCGREHVLPEDVQRVLPFVIGHRLVSSEGYGEIPQEKLFKLFMQVPVPQ